MIHVSSPIGGLDTDIFGMVDFIVSHLIFIVKVKWKIIFPKESIEKHKYLKRG